MRGLVLIRGSKMNPLHRCRQRPEELSANREHTQRVVRSKLAPQQFLHIR
jgi:hypothetical protein